MFLADLNIFMSHLKKHPTVHLSTSKALTSLQSKRKAYQKFTSFRYPCILTFVKKDTMVADKNSNLVTLVTKIIMLL